MNDKLEPVNCGCGGEVVLETDHDTIQPVVPIDWKRVRCNKCNIRTTWRKSEAEAIQVWNQAMGERTAKVRDKKDDPMVDEWHQGRCMNCGKQVRRRNNYCSRCGARLEWE